MTPVLRIKRESGGQFLRGKFQRPFTADRERENQRRAGMKANDARAVEARSRAGFGGGNNQLFAGGEIVLGGGKGQRGQQARERKQIFFHKFKAAVWRQVAVKNFPK